MVIDTSAIVAIFQAEPERDRMLASMRADAIRLISAATLVETSMVLRRTIEDAVPRLGRFLDTFDIEVVPFDREQARAADDGFIRYGKGRHRAGLNLGDCFSYALAKTTGEPLLFKGNDFSETDLRSA